MGDISDGGPRFARSRLDRLVALIAGACLMLAWVAVVLVDAFDVGGIRDVLVRRFEFPALWYHLFEDGRPIELLQFTMLGGTAVVGAATAGSLFTRDRRPAGAFWLLIATGATLLLVEDAGDLRHRVVAEYVFSFVPEGRVQTTLTELVLFALLASVPVYAVLRYWRVPWKSHLVRRYVIACFAFYAVATIASGTRDIGGEHGWYPAAGRFVQEQVFRGRLAELPVEPLAAVYPPEILHLQDAMAFILMDTLVEESLEVIGAIMLFAAALAYAHHLHREPDIANVYNSGRNDEP